MLPWFTACWFARQLHRQKHRQWFRPELPAANLMAPIPQQTAAEVVPSGNLNEAGTGLLKLRDDPKLILHPPAPSPISAGDNLHPDRRPRS
jgi:hypothetical protein